MRVIYKYPFNLDQVQTIEMPEAAQILKIDLVNNEYYLWALVNTDEAIVERTIEIFGTGHEIPEGAAYRKYLGTVNNAPFIWHVFERIELKGIEIK